MKKTLYRIVLKSCNFETAQGVPSFKIKIGKQQRIINPFCVAGAEQHYNHECIVEKTTEMELLIDCIVKEKLLASGKASFDDKKQEQKVQLLDVKKKKLGTLSITLKKIDKRFPVYQMKIDVISSEFAIELENPAKTSFFLILKMGDTHIKTKNSESGSKEPQWNQTFDLKSVEESSIIVEAWSEDVKSSTCIGSATVKLDESMNKKNSYDILNGAQKKVGNVLIRLYKERKQEEKQEVKQEPAEIVVNDKNIIPVRMLKMYILEALMKQGSLSKNTYIKVEADGQKTQTTTSIFSEGKNPKWNQTFQIEVKDTEDGKVKISLCQKDDQGIESIVGTAVLSIRDVENKQYELALKNNANGQLGKLYMQCEADWIPIKEQNSKVLEEEEQHLTQLPKVKSSVNAYKSAGSHQELQRRINEMKAKYSSKTSLHEYFYSQLNAVLEEGLLKIAKSKPTDPIRELGLFLINYKRK